MKKIYTGSYIPEERYGDKIAPEKIVGYEVEVFSYANLFWHPRNGNKVVPGGLLHPVMKIDVGNAVADFFLSASPQKGFIYSDKKARFPGNKSRLKSYLLSKEIREFEHYARLVLHQQDDQLIYQFSFKEECVTPDRPLEFKVTRYFSEGYGSDEEVSVYDSIERILPWFKKARGENLPDPKTVSLRVFPEVTDITLN